MGGWGIKWITSSIIIIAGDMAKCGGGESGEACGKTPVIQLSGERPTYWVHVIGI